MVQVLLLRPFFPMWLANIEKKKKTQQPQRIRNHNDVHVTENKKASQLSLNLLHVNTCLYHHQNPCSHLLKFYLLEINLKTVKKNKAG